MAPTKTGNVAGASTAKDIAAVHKLVGAGTS